MAAKCPSLYYERMDSSSNDKLKIAAFLQDGDRVLDVGAGSGSLAKLLLDTFPGLHVTALDPSETAIQRLRELQCQYPARLEVVQAEFSEFQPSERFNAVVFCSSMHEIFSYTEVEEYGKKVRFQKSVIELALHHAAELLDEENGRIIVRDGIATSHNRKVLVTYKDPDLKKLAERYENEFEGFPLDIIHTPLGDIMPYNSMMEMLYTVTWGEQSFSREVQEWYGYFSRPDWEEAGRQLSMSHGLFMVHFEKYLQDGYRLNLQDKVSLRSAPRLKWDGSVQTKEIEFPASNCLVVFSKCIFRSDESGGTYETGNLALGKQKRGKGMESVHFVGIHEAAHFNSVRHWR